MHLLELAFSNLSRVADTHVTLPIDAGRPAPLFVTGPAAIGKTSFLEGIIAGKEAFAAYGFPPKREEWAASFDHASISLKWALTPEEAKVTSRSMSAETKWELRTPRPPLGSHLSCGPCSVNTAAIPRGGRSNTFTQDEPPSPPWQRQSAPRTWSARDDSRVSRANPRGCGLFSKVRKPRRALASAHECGRAAC